MSAVEDEEIRGALVVSVRSGYLGKVVVKTKEGMMVQISCGCATGEPTLSLEIEDMRWWKDGVYKRNEKCLYCGSRNSTVTIHGGIRQWWCQDCGKAFMPKE